jgi:stress-induced morphogen
MSDKKYTAAMKKIYVIEALGDCIYSSMASKLSTGDLRNVYLRLAENERRMMKLAAIELRSLGLRPPRLKRKISVSVASAFFRTVPLVVQQKILFRILTGKIFSEWHAVYREKNAVLWDQLLDHEKLQHALLRIPAV